VGQLFSDLNPNVWAQRISEMIQKLTLDCPTTYQIKVQGYLEEHWSDWFDGMTIDPQVDREGTSVTILTGTVIDQAALHGLLHKLYDLAMPLLSLSCIELIEV
jgi:hypothetical protein